MPRFRLATVNGRFQRHRSLQIEHSQAQSRHSSEAIQAEDTSKEQRAGKEDSNRDQKKLKMNSLVILGFALILVTLSGSEALSCTPCNTFNCPAAPSNCKGGLALDACGCCEVCAKVKGESCGGIWGTSGKCDAGLVCDDDDSDFNAPPGKCIDAVS